MTKPPQHHPVSIHRCTPVGLIGAKPACLAGIILRRLATAPCPVVAFVDAGQLYAVRVSSRLTLHLPSAVIVGTYSRRAKVADIAADIVTWRAEHGEERAA